MPYPPLILLIPLLISLAMQIHLWLAYFIYIPWMNQGVMLYGSAGSAAAAAIFLIIYRLSASELKAWSLTFILCSLAQMLCFVGSGYLFLYSLFY